jgi:AcrR family transcriptional regulator
VGYKHQRSDILDAAIAVVRDDGLARLTFAAVAKRLSTNDRTVVYYFPTKDVLLGEVLEVCGAQVRDLLDGLPGRPSSPATLLRHVWSALATPQADPVIDVYVELIGLAAGRREPYATVARALTESWVEWLLPRLRTTDTALRRRQALGLIAQLDGLLLLRRMLGPDAAEQAAVVLGATGR